MATDDGSGRRHDRWAHVRFAVIGTLLAAPPKKGELQAALTALAARAWQHPIRHEPVRFARSTLERWYYQARHAPVDPVGRLRRRLRADAGQQPSVPASLREVVRAQYEAHRSWSYLTLSPHNRWAGAKALRDTWLAHIDAALFRPVLLVDEAQDVRTDVLNELRLLASADLDARVILTVLLAGDRRLQDRLRDVDLLPLDSRLRVKLVIDGASRDDLAQCLRHALEQAGNPRLLTTGVLRRARRSRRRQSPHAHGARA